MRTSLSLFSGATGASIMQEKLIPRKKRKIKSLSTSPAIKDPIPNQDKNTLGIKKDQSLPPHVPKFPPVFKSLIKQVDDDYHESIDTSRTDKDDISHTNQYDSIENLKSMKNKNYDDKYKGEIL